MQFRKRVVVCLVGLSSLMLAGAGCGSGDNANVRLVNAFPSQSSLDLLVDSNSMATAIGYGAASAYTSVNSGSRHVQVEVSGTSNINADQNDSLSSKSYSSVLMTSGGAMVLTDNHTAPSSGGFSMRVVNASSFLQTADVYVVIAGTDLTTVTPTFSGVNFPSASSYVPLTAGSYQVIFTLPGQKLAVLTSGSFNFTSGEVRTMLALDGLGGGFTTSVIADLN